MAIKTWTNGGGTGLWATAGNWSPSGVPATTDSVVFTSGTSGTIDMGGVAITITGMTITGVSGLTLNNATGFTNSGTTTYNGGNFTLSTTTAGVSLTGLVTVTTSASTGTFTVTSASSSVSFGASGGISFQSTGANMTVAPATTIGFGTGTLSVAAGSSGTLTFNPTGNMGTIGNFTYASTAAIVNFASTITTLTMNASSVTGTSSNVTINAATLALGAGTHGFNNATITSNITSTGIVTLGGNITTSGSWTSTTGTINISGYTINVASCVSNATIAFGTSGTSAFNITGTSGTVLQTQGSAFATSGTNNFFNLTGGGSTARTIAVNSATVAPHVNVKVTGGSYALTLGNTAGSYNDITFTGGFTGSIAGDASNITISGTLTLTSGMTVGTGAGVISFTPPTATTRTHELSGVIFNRPVTITGVDVTAVTKFSTSVAEPNINATLTVNGGKLDITDYTITTQSLAITGTTIAKVVAFGTSGKFYVTAPGAGQAIFTNTGSGSFTYTGTSNITVNTTDTGTKGIVSTAFTEATACNFYFTGGTYTLSITTGSIFRGFDTTGANVTIGNTTAAFTFYGDVVFASGTVFTTATGVMTFGYQTAVTRTFSSAVNIDRPITVALVGTATLQLNSNVTCLKAFTLTSGNLDVGTYTFTALSLTAPSGLTRKMAFGTNGKIVLTGSGSVVTMDQLQGLTGTSRIEVNNNTGTAATIATGTVAENYALNFYIVSGSYALTMSGPVNTFDFTGFTGSLVAASTASVYGDLVIPNTVGNFDGTGIITLRGSTGTSYINVGKAINRPFTFNGTKTWQLLQDFNMNGTNGALILSSGNIDANAKTLTCLTFTTSGTATRALLLNSGMLVASNGGTANAAAAAMAISGRNFSCKLSDFDTPPSGTFWLSAENTAIGVGNKAFDGGGSTVSGTITDDILTLTTTCSPAGNYLSVGQYIYACPTTPVTSTPPNAYDTGKFLGYVTEVISGVVTGTSLDAAAGAIGNQVRLSKLQPAPTPTTSTVSISSASCSGTVLTTTGSPALAAGMKVLSATGQYVGIISSGSLNTWNIAPGGTFASQAMTATSSNISLRNTNLYPEMLHQAQSVSTRTGTLTFTGNSTFKNIRSSVQYPTAMLFTASTVTGMFDLQYGNIGSGTSFTATGSATSGGTTLTLSSVSGEVCPGAVVYGTGLALGTRIVGQTGTGTLRGAGTYTITPAATAAVSGTVYAQRDCTIDSVNTAGGYHFLSDPSGVKTWVDFIALKNSYASGGAIWYAGASCNDNGNNVNWFLTRPTANFHFFT